MQHTVGILRTTDAAAGRRRRCCPGRCTVITVPALHTHSDHTYGAPSTQASHCTAADSSLCTPILVLRTCNSPALP